uniref:Uncharacterized protein n=1 Tax=Caulerpa manorensis TaxID=717648 RepID=A0A2P0QJ35_9CHLO|nr:hypothetical protein [Caulerpa manorensis]ARO74489.1 hypothetical protein [Caulerpa manorensis]
MAYYSVSQINEFYNLLEIKGLRIFPDWWDGPKWKYLYFAWFQLNSPGPYFVYTRFYYNALKFRDSLETKEIIRSQNWENLESLPQYEEFYQEFDELTEAVAKEEIYKEEGFYVDSDYYLDDDFLLSDFAKFKWDFQTILLFLIFLGLFDEALEFISNSMEKDQVKGDPRVFLEENVAFFNSRLGDSV